MTGAVTSKAFDVLLVVHLLVALAALVSLVVLRAAAAQVARDGTATEASRRSFRGGPELAVRVVHLLPLTGLGLLATSRGAYSLFDGFAEAGLALWFAISAVLEGVAFPAQRRVAVTLAAAATSPKRDAATVVRGCELAGLGLLAAAAVMILGSR